jgi:hypothetical protein
MITKRRERVRPPANERTEVLRNDGRYGARDVWVAGSWLDRHQVQLPVEVRVTAGEVEVYVCPCVGCSKPVTYHAGESFVQEPGFEYVIGSVRGGETELVSDGPIPMYMPLITEE